MHIIPSWTPWLIVAYPFSMIVRGICEYVSGRWIDGW